VATQGRKYKIQMPLRTMIRVLQESLSKEGLGREILHSSHEAKKVGEEK